MEIHDICLKSMYRFAPWREDRDSQPDQAVFALKGDPSMIPEDEDDPGCPWSEHSFSLDAVCVRTTMTTKRPSKRSKHIGSSGLASLSCLTSANLLSLARKGYHKARSVEKPPQVPNWSGSRT